MQLEQITIAVNDMPAMVTFYNGVFEAGLTQVGESPFYRGTFLGFPLLFCPNSIAQVNAEKNRQQFHVRVDDLDAVLSRVSTHGGHVQDDAYENDDQRGVGIVDPDGNTLALSMKV